MRGYKRRVSWLHTISDGSEGGARDYALCGTFQNHQLGGSTQKVQGEGVGAAFGERMVLGRMAGRGLVLALTIFCGQAASGSSGHRLGGFRGFIGGMALVERARELGVKVQQGGCQDLCFVSYAPMHMTSGAMGVCMSPRTGWTAHRGWRRGGAIASRMVFLPKNDWQEDDLPEPLPKREKRKGSLFDDLDVREIIALHGFPPLSPFPPFLLLHCSILSTTMKTLRPIIFSQV